MFNKDCSKESENRLICDGWFKRKNKFKKGMEATKHEEELNDWMIIVQKELRLTFL